MLKVFLSRHICGGFFFALPPVSTTARLGFNEELNEQDVVESGMDEYSWKINTSTLPNGMYILNVFNDDEQLIYKIMKQ